jgi:hypothetical protein
MVANFVIESFWQRGANCACVAYIKGLLLQYGAGAGLKVKLESRKIVVQLPDKSFLEFTRREIKELNKWNEISFRKYKNEGDKKKSGKIKFIVHVLFAVLVKNLRLRDQLPGRSGIKKAIAILTKKGVDTRNFHRLLGTEKGKVQRLGNRNLWRLKSKKAALLYNTDHIVAVSSGYYDNMGHAELIENKAPQLLGEKATHWFEIR